MSNAVKIIKWFSEYPVAVFVIFYAYWLVSIPTGMIVWGLVLRGTNQRIMCFISKSP
jgi:hypothetical protein